ncbi:CoA-binding protein [Patescibacteria group bacterium]|nr:CoA-binding protein [Patescibacteria group bacterium]
MNSQSPAPDLSRLWSPKCVAVVGASTNPAKLGHIVLKNLREGGLKGSLYAINPKGRRILDVPTYSEIAGVPEPVDVAVLTVPAEVVPEVAGQCGQAGVKVLIVIAAGFQELGGAGLEREAELSDIAQQYGMRVLGPNCLGLIDTHTGVNASFVSAMPPKGSVAVLSQSGAMGTAILDWASSTGLGFSKFISLGNKADLTENDFLPALENDAKTSVVLAYLEDISDGEAFVVAASKLTRVKPMILLKPGRTEAGATAAHSHTGALTGSSDAADAAFRRAGIMVARSVQELFDFTSAFARTPLPKGDNIAIVTNAGGPGVVTADDVSEAEGLEVAELSDKTESMLRKVLPAAAQVGNPVDVVGDAGANRYQVALSAVLADRAVDASVVILTPQAMTEVETTADVIAKAASASGKPVLPCFIGGNTVMPGRARLAEHGLPSFDSPSRAVVALSAMAQYAHYLSAPVRKRNGAATPKAILVKLIAEARDTEHTELGGMAAAEAVAAYGIKAPPTIAVADVDDAAAAAQKIGYPVALKIDSPDISHKTDIGGVMLDLPNDEAVKKAFAEIMKAAKKHTKDADIHGVTVSPMQPTGGLDLIVGAKRDPNFGPVLVVGYGGIFVEAVRDVAYELAPVTKDDVTELLTRTGIGETLAGTRGMKFDQSAAVKAIMAVSQLMLDCPDVVELDLNPLRVFDKGAFSLDTRIELC